MASAVFFLVASLAAPASAPPVADDPKAPPPYSPNEPKRSASTPRVSAPWLGLERRSVDEIDLEPMPGGGFQYEDENGGFRAIIAPDGSVTFEDLVRAELKGTPKSATGWFDNFVDAVQRPPGRRGASDGGGRDEAAGGSSLAGAAGMETVPWGPYGPPPVMFSIGGSFGGPGARGPSKKAQRDFLRTTETMRDGMAVRFHKKKLERAARRVTADVVAIWKDRSIPLSIRKRRVFEMWDDAEPPVGDKGPIAEALTEGSHDVRLRIEKAVRMLAPKGSEDAYSAEELEELNAKRRGKEPFAPYSTPSHKSGRRRR